MLVMVTLGRFIDEFNGSQCVAGGREQALGTGEVVVVSCCWLFFGLAEKKGGKKSTTEPFSEKKMAN